MTDKRKSIFITGAASGIGRATADLFASKGWFVGGFDINEEGLAKLRDDLGADNCLVATLDVVDRGQWKDAIGTFSAATGGTLDLFFNNAGIGIGGMFADFSLEDIDRIVDINFKGVLNGIHFALPLLRETPGSLCFNTSSSSAIYGAPGLAIYSATKHAVKGLTEALSVEFAALGIRAADTLPGIIDTPIWELAPGMIEQARSNEGPWRVMPASAVADAVWEAYRGTKLHYYVPEDLETLEQKKAADATAIRDGFLAGRAWE